MKRTVTALLALLLAFGLYLATAQNNQQQTGQGNAAQQGNQQSSQQTGELAGQQGGQQVSPQGNDEGAQIYQQCAVCHGSNGQGGSGPALAGDKNIQDANFQIDTILNGRGAMPSWAGALSDEQIAAVATHERTSWGNDFGEITAQQVSQRRSQSGGKGQNAPTSAKVGGFGTQANDQFGTLLATNDGLMVYRFVNDRIDGQSHCYNPCTTHWLPVTTGNGSPQLSNRLNPASFGSIQRDSNTSQVTYEGWPLYVYAPDQAQVQQTQSHAQDAQAQSDHTQSSQAQGDQTQGAQTQSSQAPSGQQGAQAGGGQDGGGGQEGRQGDQQSQAQPAEPQQSAQAQGGQARGDQAQGGGQPTQAGQTGQVSGEQQGAQTQGAQAQGGQGVQPGAESGEQGSVDGSQVFTQAGCNTCHGQNGEGGVGPALAGNNNLQDTQHVINQILNGGGGMPAFSNQLTAAEVAAVATHERTSWGNNFGPITTQEVTQAQGGTQNPQGQQGAQGQQTQSTQAQNQQGQQGQNQQGAQGQQTQGAQSQAGQGTQGQQGQQANQGQNQQTQQDQGRTGGQGQQAEAGQGGGLQITAQPADAVISVTGADGFVFVADVSENQGHQTISDLAPGDYLVAATAKGHQLSESQVSVKQGQATEVSLTLPKSGADQTGTQGQSGQATRTPGAQQSQQGSQGQPDQRAQQSSGQPSQGQQSQGQQNQNQGQQAQQGQAAQAQASQAQQSQPGQQDQGLGNQQGQQGQQGQQAQPGQQGNENSGVQQGQGQKVPTTEGKPGQQDTQAQQGQGQQSPSTQRAPAGYEITDLFRPVTVDVAPLVVEAQQGGEQQQGTQGQRQQGQSQGGQNTQGQAQQGQAQESQGGQDQQNQGGQGQ